MFKSIDLQFRCSNCDFVSLDVKATQIHLKICGKPDDFECFVCDRSFKTEKILSKHHSLIHGLSDGYEDTETIDQPSLINDHTNDQPNLDDNQTNSEVENDNGQVPDQDLSCPICKLTFVKERALLNHLLKEHIDQTDKEPRLYQCYECQAEFNHLDSLNDHIAIKHKKDFDKTPEVYKCKTCHQEFNLESKLLLHMKTKHTKTSTCHLEESLNIKEELIEDDAFEPVKVKIETIKTEPNKDNGQVPVKIETIKTEPMKMEIDEFDEDFKCQVCSSKFTNIHELKNHILVIHLFTQFECHHCQTKFDNFEELQSHSCQETMTFICHICDDNRSFDLTNDLANHLLDFHFRFEEPKQVKETIEEPETIENPETIEEQETIEEPEETNEKTPEKKRNRSKTRKADTLQKCQLCDQECISFEKLTLHYIVDHLKIKIECQECDLQFKSYKDLGYHNRKCHPHRKRSLTCLLCSKECASGQMLYHHMMSAHLQIKPFSCNECGEKFASSHYLKVHLRRHHK